MGEKGSVGLNIYEQRDEIHLRISSLHNVTVAFGDVIPRWTLGTATAS